jgi:hypothetical protein
VWAFQSLGKNKNMAIFLFLKYLIHNIAECPSALLDFEYGRNCGCKQINWIYDGCILFLPLFIGILQLYF